MRLIPGLSRTVGYAAGGTLALGLLVCGCVFAAMAGPALSLHTRTQALQQTMAGVSDTTKAVQVSDDWEDFTSPLNSNTGFEGIGEGEDLSLSTLSLATSEMGRGFAATPLPLGPGQWASLTTNTLVVSGAGPRAQAGAPPKLEVTYRDPLTGNARVVAGSYASPAGLPRGTVAVAATQQTAARYGLHPGSRLAMAVQGGVVVKLYVTAILAERASGSTFWAQDILAGTPQLNMPPSGGPASAAATVTATSHQPSTEEAEPPGTTAIASAAPITAAGTVVISAARTISAATWRSDPPRARSMASSPARRSTIILAASTITAAPTTIRLTNSSSSTVWIAAWVPRNTDRSGISGAVIVSPFAVAARSPVSAGVVPIMRLRSL